MRAILIVSTHGPVVFHTALCPRSFIDNVVRVVEGDYHTQRSFALGRDVDSSAILHPKSTRLGFQERNPMDNSGVMLRGAAIVESLVMLFVEDHPWILEAGVDTSLTILWRKVEDRVFIFALEEKDNLALAKHSLSTFVTLLSDAFKSRDSLPPLKELQNRPELIQTVCDVFAPQNHLVCIDTTVARQTVSKLR